MQSSLLVHGWLLISFYDPSGEFARELWQTFKINPGHSAEIARVARGAAGWFSTAVYASGMARSEGRVSFEKRQSWINTCNGSVVGYNG